MIVTMIHSILNTKAKVRNRLPFSKPYMDMKGEANILTPLQTWNSIRVPSSRSLGPGGIALACGLGLTLKHIQQVNGVE